MACDLGKPRLLASVALYALFTLGLQVQAQHAAAEDTHLYSPDTNLERSELDMLRTAKRSIDIAMYSFTDRELADELAVLARSGFNIRVYRDRTEFKQESERSDENTSAILAAAGVEVRVKGAKDLMHLKSYCIDRKMVRTGSPTGHLQG